MVKEYPRADVTRALLIHARIPLHPSLAGPDRRPLALLRDQSLQVGVVR